METNKEDVTKYLQDSSGTVMDSGVLLYFSALICSVVSATEGRWMPQDTCIHTHTHTYTQTAQVCGCASPSDQKRRNQNK